MNWMLLPPLRRLVGQAALASLALNLALAVPALYMLQVFDRVLASRSVETLVMLTGLAVGALGLAFAMDRVRAALLARAGREVEDALAAPALSSLLDEAARGRGDRERGALPDIARLRGFLAGPAVQALLDAPWLPLHLALIALLHPLLGLVATAAALLLVAVGAASERLLRADSERAVRQARESTAFVEALQRQAEAIAGTRQVTAAVARWQRVHGELAPVQDRLAARGAALAALGRTLRQAVQVAMLATGAALVVVDHASAGIMIAATLLVGRALQPVEHLVAGWKSLLEVRAAWARLQAQPVADAAAGLHHPAPRGDLVVERVTLAVDAARPPLLRQVSLTVAAGECLGLIGPSAAGKTTLLRVLLGLRQPQAGVVRLDGIELGQWRDDDLAGAIGYLPQDAELLAGTVAQNIARLGEVDDGAVLAAARLAGVHELIARLPQGYDTPVGEGGAVLSGGQRQRIALARAVYGAPRLVILDEPNSHLDREGEQALAGALAALKRAGTTVVMVSHRPALMQHADRLAVLRDGAIEALGPRDEVLARLDNPGVQPLRRPVAPLHAASATPAVESSHAPSHVATA